MDLQKLTHVALNGLVASIASVVWFNAALAQERALAEQSASTNRVALLVGNRKYHQEHKNSDYRPFRTLNNPCNDIERVAAILETSGWEQKDIISICDATRSQFTDVIAKFKDAYLSSEHSFGFVYYAGHGIQLRNETFLFGVDSFLNPRTAASIAASHNGASIFPGGVRLFGDLISQVGDAGSGSIFIVVDACRETLIDELARRDAKVASVYFNSTTGYPRPALGIKMLYSTEYGKLASDGIGNGSPFSLAFEESLKAEGRVDVLVALVIKAVRQKTMHSAVRQFPDTTGSLNPPPPSGCLTVCRD